MSSSYVPGLDGIRAVAVLAVMAYHGGVPGAPGGFLGVDVFFVLSGFLITSLLLSEWRRSGRISLVAFWGRRARRLLPALFLVVATVAALATVLVAPEDQGVLRSDGLATLAYVGNWHQIVAGQGYFASAAAPSPLLHTWSLAIEEQFYLVWPVVLVLVLRRHRRGRPAATSVLGLAVVGVVASAVEMAVLYRPGFDPSRVYYGTDTRAQTILVGAALAALLWLHPRVVTATGRWILSMTGLAGAAVIALTVASSNGSSGLLFRGGFLSVAVAAAAVVATVVLVPTGMLARFLSVSPLRYLGRISYGLYLWHWPVYLLVDGARTGLRSWDLALVRFAITLVVATISYYAVEKPIRERGLTVLRTLGARIVTPVAGMVGVGALVVVTTSAASLPSAATAAASSSQPVVRQLQGGSVRMLLEGDSIAVTLGMGWQPVAARYGVSLENKAIIGCGLANGGDVRDRGAVEQNSYGALLVPCANWPRRFESDLKELHPDVAALLVGSWEIRDRTIDGTWQHIGQPDFDHYEQANLQRAVDILGSTGAHVVLFTVPYIDQGESPSGAPWPEDDPRRVDDLNRLLYGIESANPGRVSVLDLGRLLSPAGAFTRTIDGLSVRYPDGVHISEAGGRWLAPRLLPLVAALGHPSAH